MNKFNQNKPEKRIFILCLWSCDLVFDNEVQVLVLQVSAVKSVYHSIRTPTETPWNRPSVIFWPGAPERKTFCSHYRVTGTASPRRPPGTGSRVGGKYLSERLQRGGSESFFNITLRKNWKIVMEWENASVIQRRSWIPGLSFPIFYLFFFLSDGGRWEMWGCCIGFPPDPFSVLSQ